MRVLTTPHSLLAGAGKAWTWSVPGRMDADSGEGGAGVDAAPAWGQVALVLWTSCCATRSDRWLSWGLALRLHLLFEVGGGVAGILLGPAVAIGLGHVLRRADRRDLSRPPPTPYVARQCLDAGMRLLVVGGTRFIGKHVVAAALAAGHDVTLVHRRPTSLFPDARHVLADRNGDLSALADDAWDATIDVCAYLPGQVRSLAAVLGGRGGHHVLVSSVSVYGDLPGPGGDEDSPLLPVAGDDVDEVTGETYGPLKVACERAAAEVHGDRLAVVRPTYVVGPDDYTGRFPWWVRRMARGGEVLAPGAPDHPAQVVDVRDLADLQVRLAAGQVPGPFNAVRPVVAWSELLEAAATVAPPGTSLTWVDGAWLAEQGVTARELPLWSEGVAEWQSAMSPGRAQAQGLRHRPLAEVVRDTAAWVTDDRLVPGVGLAAEREAELLGRWRG